jgi:integrase
MPLTSSSLNKLFRSLRRRVPGMPDDLSPHVLRHTWNDDFSEASDHASPHRTDVERRHEERMRAYLMGWSANSQMPALYSKRWTEEAANKRLLKQQGRHAIISVVTKEQEVG